MSKFLLITFFCLTVLASCGGPPRQPALHIAILSDMVEAIPAEAFRESRVFPDGKVLQSPVAGTVPRGAVPLPYPATEEGAARAGEELKNPFRPEKPNLERGRFVYENFCRMCHGPAGEGDGQLIPKYPNPPSFSDKRVKSAPDGRLFHSITLGRKDMPSHASQLDSADRWKVLLYVRELAKGGGK